MELDPILYYGSALLVGCVLGFFFKFVPLVVLYGVGFVCLDQLVNSGETAPDEGLGKALYMWWYGQLLLISGTSTLITYLVMNARSIMETRFSTGTIAAAIFRKRH